MNTPPEAMPELPEPYFDLYDKPLIVMFALFTADQMQAYAKAHAASLKERLEAAEQRSQWQPIETVPGHCAVLVFSQSRNISIERAEHIRELIAAAKEDGDECFYTHWMHLPNDPAAQREQG